ncbi:MAG: hypothetical protein Q9166_005871 [cf. Caloplaca sp. 2 TL-2023]
MVFETLHRLGTRADLLLLYSSEFYLEDSASEEDKADARLTEDQRLEVRLLKKARDEYHVKLKAVTVQRRHIDDPGSATWGESYTKLTAFNQTQYRRIIALDSDSTVLQTMDELFLLPAAPVVLPRAYWLDGEFDVAITSAIMLIQPSTSEYNLIADAIAHAGRGEFDMEILNTLYKDSAPTLPHRPYALLSQVLRWGNHSSYLGDRDEAWHVDAILKEAKYLHFSEWPLPKPWIRPDPNLVKEHWPSCVEEDPTNQMSHCRNRQAWIELYRDFKRRRKAVCGIDVKNVGDVVDF